MQALSDRRYIRAASFAVVLSLVASACATRPPATPAAMAEAPAQVQAWITTADHRMALQPVAVSEDPAQAPAEIQVDIGTRHQRMLGFGASLTDSSAWLIQHRMSPEQRAALLQELFGRNGNGIGLEFTRLTIGASDFSRHHYSLDDPADGKPDPELRHFSTAPNLGDVVPIARQALAVNPRLQVMASPWSAPGWMKDSNSLIKGKLRPEYYDAFSRYLLKYVDAYAAEGIPIFALTVQNEPDYEPGDYPGMRLNAPARARLIGDHLGPLIARRGKGGPLIFDWDHNWDKPQEPMAVLADPAAGPHVAGVAWHCYGGEVAAQSPVRDAFPDKDVYMTECSDGTWEPVRSGGLVLQAQQLVVQTTRHWARGVLFWNLALDEKGGPHAGGCDTCIGVVTIDSKTGAVTRNHGYYALAHASRFVRPDAYRIASTATGDGLDNVAFQNSDDGSVVLVVTNSNQEPRTFSVSQQDRRFRHTLPARSVATFRWMPAAAR